MVKRKIIQVLLIIFFGSISLQANQPKEDGMLKKEAEIALFYMPGCPYSVKVLDYLEKIHKTIVLKNLDEDSQAKENLISRGGKMQVPCLLIGDLYLYDSDTIIEWLSEHKDDLTP